MDTQDSSARTIDGTAVDGDPPVDPWRLVRTSADRAGFAQDETLFALANGSLGVRAGLEEDDSPSQGSFLAGVWERTAIEYHERFPGFARSTDSRVPVADGVPIRLQLGDAPVRLDEGEWLAFDRCLDLRHGRYRRSLRWRSADGATLAIDAERLVCLDRPALLAIRYRVRSIDYRGPLTLHSAIDGAHHAAGQGDDPRIGSRLDGGLRVIDTGICTETTWLTQATTHSGIRLACGQRHRLPGTAQSIGVTEGDTDIEQSFVAALEPGQEVVLEKFVAYAWTGPGQERAPGALVDDVVAQLQNACATGYDALAGTQSRALQTFWDDADLAIDGDPSVEQALRLNLFHVFQSTCRDGTGSAAAKGLTGEGYEGHYFWDAEVFMLPAMLAMDPSLARGMLEFRYRVLDRARHHAREMNHARGALYAWRTISGDECSAYFPSGSAQYHINAAVAWAIRLYVDASGDEGFLVDKGAEILFETARVWLDVGHFEPRRQGAFCIPAVTGPDEYTALVDNNHYTNRMAQRHLRDAAAVANWMKEEHPGAYAALADRIGLAADEPDAWRCAADAMYLPVDAATGVFPQDDTFLRKPRLPPQDGNGGKHPLLLRMHPLTIYRYQVCKQADVLLALVLAGNDVEPDAMRRNLDYYEAVTVHDSTLSASTFGVVAAEVGDMAKAYRYFLDTLRVDLDDSHGNAAHGVHLAAMAGSWITLAWGFGGLRIDDGRLSFAPRLPGAWRGYRFGVRWRDTHVRVAVDAEGAHYTLTRGEAIDIHHGRERLHLTPGRTVDRLAAGTPAAPALPRILQAVIFDLDGVIADTASVHQAAWERLAGDIGVPFDDSIGERLKGVDRQASLDIVLEAAARPYSPDEREALAARKNSYYRAQIENFEPTQLLPGARGAIDAVRRAGLKVALASACRNAPLLLERLQIADLFDYVVDAGRIARSKPDPAIFLDAAAGLGVAPESCLGVEDAAAGIASIHAAGMLAVGIGDRDALADADVVLPDIAAFDIAAFTAS